MTFWQTTAGITRPTTCVTARKLNPRTTAQTTDLTTYLTINLTIGMTTTATVT